MIAGETGILTWDEYFMSVAFLSSLRSVDADRKGGACIVNADNRIVGIGYCGYPRGVDDLSVGGDLVDDKKLYVCHSIMNAILNKNQYDIRGCRLYCTHFPCNECAKMIIQSGISRVTYNVDVGASSNENSEASKILFSLAGISSYRYQSSSRNSVVLNHDAGTPLLFHS
jgi:dCMP deaminase